MSSEFGRLKDPAKAATLGKLKLRLAHLNALDALGPTETWLDGVPPGNSGRLPAAHHPHRRPRRGGDDVLQAHGHHP
jgi:hypothetical protein